MTSRGSTWPWNTMSAISVISALAGCAATPGGHGAGPRDPGSPPSAPDDETTRGIHVEQGRLGFDHKLEVRPSKAAMAHELHDGDTVTTGDRIRATTVTSEDAYLYVAFCARHELAIYPSQHGVRTTAGSSKLVLEGNGELVVDGEPGAEMLYLIVSRTELSLADPRLSAKLAAASQDGKVVDCGANLDTELARPAHQDGSASPTTPPATRVLRGQLVPKQRMPAGHARASHWAPDPPTRGANASAPPPDEPDFIRNPGTIVWYGADGAGAPQDVVAADADGIAVVRYRFTHAARNSSP